MSGLVNRFNTVLVKAFEWFAVACTIVIIISTSVQVFTRYVLGAALIGTEEVARYSFVWANMMGASICVSRFSHASVSFVPDLLKGKLKQGHTILIQLLIFLFSLILVVQGYAMIQVTLRQMSPTLGLPMWLVYLAIPVGGAGIAVGSLNNILQTVHQMRRGGEGEV